MQKVEDETRTKVRLGGKWYYKYTCLNWSTCKEQDCPLEQGGTVLECADAELETAVMVPTGKRR